MNKNYSTGFRTKIDNIILQQFDMMMFAQETVVYTRDARNYK